MILVKLVAVAFSILLAICALLYVWQDKLLFFPKVPLGYEDPAKNPEGLKNPGEYGIRYEDVSVESTDGVVVHAWFMKQSDSSARPTLMFLQGNAGNMGFRLPNLVDLFRTLKCNIVAPSYRGYGYSTGKPSEAGLKADVRSVIEHLTVNASSLGINSNRLFLFGRSLGGAAAIYLAHEFPDQIQGLVLENTFLSIKEMAKQLIPPLRKMEWLLNILTRIGFNSDQLIKNVRIPILFISGEDDTLVPPFHMERLFELAASCKFKWLVKVAGATHNDTWQTCPRDYYATILRFVAEVETQKTPSETAKEIRLNTGTQEDGKACLKPRGPKFYEVMPRQVAQSKA
eukprot:Gregarina_sp_Poly_1__8765@NODE_525_length_7703_cov_51_704164_g416_i0_p3_GENE_NODE_525_length_7703_cov_51_704164_g416_i0NODE_525_length_7703_cov_51_704164_g416_i0_p3_ORF_typecomplete_len343_score35_94Hydrolase_4/PF12146_8/1_5e28DUF818/PF05677_12/7_8e26Abhydrolase_1/PF00561_20/2_4e19Peptidase_S9/PF00326_21/2_4e17DUF1057/PF06342_12/1_2e13Abhydrolase_6/PF12697_7/4_8e13Abhydrolase_2/PF02230_16/2e12Abhydrolase_3/PF07859_13/6_8e10Abhydrolase_5/PF12695_7/1_2e08Peptidase_S15/PF02129_18/3_3e08DLH/PF01738_